MVVQRSIMLSAEQGNVRRLSSLKLNNDFKNPTLIVKLSSYIYNDVLQLHMHE